MKILSLETDTARKTQKIIRMTKHGQKVVMDARACLDEIEAALTNRIGASSLAKLKTALGNDWGPPLGTKSASS
ncbi:MAG: hypothetical protein CTY20_08735 [Hyphomicrobium sp.]|nr:MAG: hypothetical protein CTY20_08735 [Hyphomicrobium sp.]